MLILGIETSCDDTSVAVLDAHEGVFQVRSNVVSSQIQVHNPYGGVVPVLAAREHEKNLPLVLPESLKKAGVTMEQIDLIAVTSGPGLIMSLVRGVNFAKDLAQKYHKPLVGTNHMAGHVYSNWLTGQAPELPALCLVVSGGHTELVLMKNHNEYELLGRTKDDASGEAFDKIARLIGLEYPGGPAISREAAKFSGKKTIDLPRPMMHSKDLDFSFSGLKTSVYYLVRDLRKEHELTPEQIIEISHEAQEAIVDVLISKTKKAIEQYQPVSVLLAGGVSANKLLREKIQALGQELDIAVSIPPMEFTTDNAAMIAMAAYFNQDTKDFEPNANWEIA